MKSERKLAEIEERVSKTTEGKWIRRGGYIHPKSFDYRCVIDCLSHQDAYDWDANAEFICHAREDIQFLLAEVRKLTGTLIDIQRLAKGNGTKNVKRV